MRDNVAGILLGKPEVVELALVTLLARGHLLLEDIPGVGKTTLARALAQSLHGRFRRIQFTADLLPSDVLGVSVYQSETATFVFQPGPIFAHVVLADEINRTTPRTQSCLLEAMNDGQVSVDGITRPLPAPFLVVATQNPQEYLGTYPLPESQLDRFLMRIRIGYPDRESEREVLRTRRRVDPLHALEPVLATEEVVRLQALVREIRVDPAIEDYILAIAAATRDHPEIEVGMSPRASLALSAAAQARALVHSRDYVIPDDVKVLAVPVCAHRVVFRDGVGLDSLAAEGRMHELLEGLPVPR
ncbi:MAG: MoxR family ATPase [Planctomycetes bacterium]|nr:MoxR family ATPase [Planctomycetota bacterium]